MKINIHYPTSMQGIEKLAKRVAVVHAEITAQYIEKLPCSKEQKAALFDAIISEAQTAKK